MDRGGARVVVVAASTASVSSPPLVGDGTTTAAAGRHDVNNDDARNDATSLNSKRVRVMEMNASERRAYVRELVQRTREV
jgi:hypothetical protein